MSTEETQALLKSVITTAEAAAILGISPRGVQKLVEREVLPARSTDAGLLLPRSAVQARARSRRKA